jgi:hypothetical protein
VSANEAAWLTEYFRCTIFTSPVESATKLWSSIVDSSPEAVNAKPKLATETAEGPLSDRAKLTVQTTPGRVDVVTTATGKEFPANVDDMTLGRFDQGALDNFRSLVRPVIESGSVVTRVAFGAVAIWPRANKQASYQRLAELLPTVRIDPRGSSDFLYQINRPRPSTTVAGVSINRLARWAALRAVSGLFSEPIVAVDLEALAKMPGAHEVFGARIELDVNTTSFEHKPANRYMTLFSELQSLALELALNGDVP